MQRSKSMNDITMEPEEARVAASLLRLTSSEDEMNQRDDKCQCDYDKYIGQHCQFPYHRAVQSVTIPERKRIPKRRCNSIPVSEPAVTKPAITKPASFPFRQSAPSEGKGIFQRFVPNFIRRRLSSSDNQETFFRHQEGKEMSGQFIRQFNLITTNMDNLLFMSLR